MDDVGMHQTNDRTSSTGKVTDNFSNSLNNRSKHVMRFSFTTN